MIFGAAIGYKVYSLTNNIWLAGFFALLSHYFLDLFPHVEYLSSAENLGLRIKKEKFKSYFPDILKVFLDFLIGVILVFSLSNNQPSTYIFVFLSIFPDGVTIINALFYNKFLKIHQKFHGDIVQYLTKSKNSPILWRIFTQATAVAVSILILVLVL